MSENIILKALDKAAAALGVNNMARPPGQSPIGPSTGGMYEGAEAFRGSSAEREPLSLEAARELTPRIIPPAVRDAVEAYPHQPRHTERRAAVRAGFEGDKSVWVKIESGEVRYQAAHAVKYENTHDALRVSHKQHLETQLAKTDLRDANTQSFEEWLEHGKRLRRAADHRMAAETAEAIKYLLPEAHRYRDLCFQAADETDEGERLRCEDLAVPFEPSRIAMILRKCGDQVVKQLQSAHPTCGLSPKALASFLPI